MSIQKKGQGKQPDIKRTTTEKAAERKAKTEERQRIAREKKDAETARRKDVKRQYQKSKAGMSEAGIDALKRIAKADAIQAAEDLGEEEARFLVDMYYLVQGNRIRAGNQTAALARTGEPAFFEGYVNDSMESVEKSIYSILDRYSDNHPVGSWCRRITGIGPVLSAGLIAHIDIEKAETAGAIHRYAGYDPTSRWEKGQKRPWNASLKTLCWKIGESFVKVSGNEKDIYGKVWAARKELEIQRNDAGLFADQAAEQLKKNWTNMEIKAIYESGKLPPGHIHARAKRYAVKLFLSHLHGAWYRWHFKKEPPLPYPIVHLGHVHFIPPPFEIEG